MNPKPPQNPHRGSDLREFLEEEGLLQATEALALKRALVLQFQQIMESRHLTKTQFANRMKTSRAALDRMLDPENPSLTVATLGKAAAALGHRVEVRLIPA